MQIQQYAKAIPLINGNKKVKVLRKKKSIFQKQKKFYNIKKVF